MTCERAQEFLSDYVEESLERPMALALEVHLNGCAACTEAVERLRATWRALDAVPAVEPPRELAWQVLLQLRQRRIEELEAQRQRPVSFWDWARTWRPVRVAMAAGLATLIVGGLLIWRSSPNDPQPLIVVPVPRIHPPSHAPGIELSMAAQPGRQVQVRVRPSQQVDDLQVWLNGVRGQVAAAPLGGYEAQFRAAGTDPAPRFELILRSAKHGLERRYHCWISLDGRGGGHVTLPRRQYTLADAVRAITAQGGATVIFDGDHLEQEAELVLVDQPPGEALAMVAEQFGLRYEMRETIHHLSRR